MQKVVMDLSSLAVVRWGPIPLWNIGFSQTNLCGNGSKQEPMAYAVRWEMLVCLFFNVNYLKLKDMAKKKQAQFQIG